MILYIALFGLTIFIYFYFNGFEACRIKVAPKKVGAQSADTVKMETICNENNSTVYKKEFCNINYDSADVVTKIGPQNICIGIFKNPVDHRTHFYRTRLKGMYIQWCCKSVNPLPLY